MHNRRPIVLLTAALAAAALTAGAAGPVAAGEDGQKKRPPRLRVLVTNDDGVRAEGLDALVEALRDERRLKITVVAPVDNQSGTSDRTSTPPLAGEAVETLSGREATAVDGFPADSVLYALDEMGLNPHLVISGINEGQNLGPVVDISGTVGAAKTAVRRGIPALAVSQGIGDPLDYPAAVERALDWLQEHRKALRKAKGEGAEEVASLNVPTCLTGKIRGLEEELPIATGGEAVLSAEQVNCESTLTDPVDDVQAFNNGFATLVDVPVE